VLFELHGIGEKLSLLGREFLVVCEPFQHVLRNDETGAAAARRAGPTRLPGTWDVRSDDGLQTISILHHRTSSGKVKLPARESGTGRRGMRAFRRLQGTGQMFMLIALGSARLGFMGDAQDSARKENSAFPGRRPTATVQGRARRETS
jgi:hypothetical protein